MKNKNLCLLAAIILITLLSSVANSSYPPTATKVSGDTNYQTTFNFDFSNFTGTRSGTNLSLGVLGISGGGTGQTTATSAINALLPSQGGNNGKFLQTDGTNTSWVTGGVSSQWVTSGSNIYYDTGNVGVGTTNPSYKFHLSDSFTNAKVPSFFEGIQSVSSNGAYNTETIEVYAKPIISSGVTNSGTVSSIYASTLRNSYNTDAGTLSTIRAISAPAGHTNAGRTLAPVTTNVSGFYNVPYIQSGTISNYYGLFLASKTTITPVTWSANATISANTYIAPTVSDGYYYYTASGGTTGATEPTWPASQGGTGTDNTVSYTGTIIPSITNQWGVYQADSTAKNFFNGNTGFGTSAPTETLQVYGNLRMQLVSSNILLDTNNSSGPGILWKNSTYTKDSTSIKLVDNAGSFSRYGLGFFTGDASDTTTAASERMRITRAGNVGIGTTSPSGILEAVSSTTTYPIYSTSYYTGATADGGIWARHARGTAASPTAVASGDRLGGFYASGYTDTGWGAVSTAIYSAAQEAFTSTAQGTNIRFETTPIGTASRTEKMRITADGNVGVGTSVPSTYGFLSVLAPSQSTGLGTLAAYSNDTGGAADLGGNITFGGNDGVTSSRTYAEIRGRKENGTSGNYASYLSFVNRANGGSLTEKMRIDSSGNVGIGTTSPNSLLTVNGPISTAIVSKTSATYNITATDSVILMAATSGTQSVTLPTAVGCAGRQYIIKRTATGGTSYTIATTSSQTIDGSTTAALSAQYQSIIVVSDGANWFIL